MDIRENMLPVLGPQGGNEEIDSIRETIEGVDVDSIRQGQMTKFKLKDGSYVMINDENVLMVEVFAEEEI